MKYILIDYENIQPKCLNGLSEDYHIWILIGNKQRSITESLEDSLKRFSNVEKVKLEKTAKNALDFILFQYVGQIISYDKYANILILSNDTGFDVPIEFLKNNHQCQCIRRIGKDELSVITMPRVIKKPVSQIPKILNDKYARSKPKTINKLISTLEKNFGYTEQQIRSWLGNARQQGLVSIDNNGRIYYLFSAIEQVLITKMASNRPRYTQSFHRAFQRFRFSESDIEQWINQAEKEGKISIDIDDNEITYYF